MNAASHLVHWGISLLCIQSCLCCSLLEQQVKLVLKNLISFRCTYGFCRRILSVKVDLLGRKREQKFLLFKFSSSLKKVLNSWLYDVKWVIWPVHRFHEHPLCIVYESISKLCFRLLSKLSIMYLYCLILVCYVPVDTFIHAMSSL